MLVTLPIEQPIGRFDDLIAGCFFAHHDTSPPKPTLDLEPCEFGRSSYLVGRLSKFVKDAKTKRPAGGGPLA